MWAVLLEHADGQEKHRPVPIKRFDVRPAQISNREDSGADLRVRTAPLLPCTGNGQHGANANDEGRNGDTTCHTPSLTRGRGRRELLGSVFGDSGLHDLSDERRRQWFPFLKANGAFGGFVALQAARSTQINRLVTYDAAVSLSGNLHGRWRPELEAAVTAGQLDHAWAHLVQGLGTAGPISYLPMGALRMLSILSAQTRLGSEMRSLLPTAVAEMRAVLDADAHLHDFTSLVTPTLMLSGGWSPSYFAETGRTLAGAVPVIDFAIVPLQFHDGPLRPGRRLAARIARFLSGGTAPVPARPRINR